VLYFIRFFLYFSAIVWLAPASANNVSGGSALQVYGAESHSRVMRISGKGFSKTIRLNAYDSARFPPYDDEGNRLPDGIYNYEVRAITQVPASYGESKSLKGPLAAAGKSDYRTKVTLVKASTFRVSGGSVIPFVAPSSKRNGGNY